MSPVEIWMSATYWNQAKEVEMAKMFEMANKKSLLIVESEDEYNYCWAMQLICGGEIQMILKEDWLNIGDYLKKFSRVFTTWDPSDRNRI